MTNKNWLHPVCALYDNGTTSVPGLYV